MIRGFLFARSRSCACCQGDAKREARRFLPLVVMVLMLWGSQPACASVISVPVVQIDPSCLTTSDSAQTYLTGTVSIGKGQVLALLDETGTKVLRKIVLPNTGGTVSFCLQVPKANIRTGHNQITRLQLRSLSAAGITASKFLPIEIAFYDPPAPEEPAAEDPVKPTDPADPSTSGKTYTVIFDGNGATGGHMKKLVLTRGRKAALPSNGFTRTGYRFAGWSLKKNDKIYMKSFQLGKVKYANREEVKDLAKAGGSVTLHACWKGCGPQAACDWAVRIASDNSFNYGSKPVASRYGCYFCGTNKLKVRLSGGDKRFLKTYVCMTFVNAAYVHGANEMHMKCTHRSGRCLDGRSRLSQNKKRVGKVFRSIGKPKKSKLQPGDILLAYKGRKNHTAMYIGGGKIVHATTGHGVWTKASIAVWPFTDTAYRHYDAVMRYR